jgi:hypothetical protein
MEQGEGADHIESVHIHNRCADAQPYTKQPVKEKQYNWILQNKWLIHTIYHTNVKNIHKT